jgi:transposase
MMGIKARTVAPANTVCLADLVPMDHFYRHLERTLDLSFVRDLVAPFYAACGRPSIDPVVSFKLQLVVFFAGLRSERQLMRVVADRLSVRWYLGYDLGEALPDHASLTKIRERYELETFHRHGLGPSRAGAVSLRRFRAGGGRESLVSGPAGPGAAIAPHLVTRSLA